MNQGRGCTILRIPHRQPWQVCMVLLFGLVLFASCQGVREPSIEDLHTEEILAGYEVRSLTGRRDGDRLPARVVFEDSSTSLILELEFRIGVPTRLESGRYYWNQGYQVLEGSVQARSVTFLGGQSDHPNLGGVFELLSSSGSPIYKVTLPTTEVRPPVSQSLAPSH